MDGIIVLTIFPSLACVLIPFTATNMFVKSTLHFNAASFQDLSICAETLQILAERYDTADFYVNLLEESLVITHKMMLEDETTRGRNAQNKYSDFDKEVEVPLPQADIYSAVIRFQELSFSTGCIERSNPSLLRTQLISL